MTVRTGVGSMTVRLTVHSFSCESETSRGTSAAAAAPDSVSGKEIRKVTSTSDRWLPRLSETLTPLQSTTKDSGSLRRVVTSSTSTLVQPAIAASNNSTGV